MNKLAVTLLLLVFVTGIYVVMTFPSCGCKKEGFESRECPDLLVQKNDRLLLYFTNQPKEDGHNPLPFFSLDVSHTAYPQRQAAPSATNRLVCASSKKKFAQQHRHCVC